MTITEALAAYGPDVLSVRLVEAVLDEVPDSPLFGHYASVDDAVRALSDDPSAAVLEAARAHASDASVEALLWMPELLDAADRRRVRPFGPAADPEGQADDAVLKALGLGWLAWRLGEGDVDARVASLLSLPAGRTFAIVWAAVEVALPIGGADLGRVFRERALDQANRLASMAGERSLQGAQPGLHALAAPLQAVLDVVAPRARSITEAAAPFVPGLIGHRQGAEDVVASRADRMPLYKLLGARLAAEHAARRALGLDTLAR